MTRVLVRYARGGGRTPADDESLEIAEGGGFEARRTVGGARVGRFAGTLPGSTLRGLGSSIRAVAGADDLAMPTPRDGATETIEVEGRTAQLDGNARPPEPWKGLVTKLRRLLDERVLESPVAALELSPDGTRLAHLGTEALGVDPTSIAVRRVALAPNGVPTEHRFSGATALLQRARDLVDVVGGVGEAVGRSGAQRTQTFEQRSDALALDALNGRIVLVDSVEVRVPAVDFE